jgi:hypothetical protein
MILINGMSLLARVSRSDVNTPGYDDLAFSSLLRDAQLEVAAYEQGPFRSPLPRITLPSFA